MNYWCWLGINHLFWSDTEGIIGLRKKIPCPLYFPYSLFSFFSYKVLLRMRTAQRLGKHSCLSFTFPITRYLIPSLIDNNEKIWKRSCFAQAVVTPALLCRCCKLSSVKTLQPIISGQNFAIMVTYRILAFRQYECHRLRSIAKLFFSYILLFFSSLTIIVTRCKSDLKG